MSLNAFPGGTPGQMDPIAITLRSLLATGKGSDRFSAGLRMALEARLESLHSESEASSISLAPYRLRRAQDFLEANLCREIRLDDVAAAAGLSPYHFCRQFKKATGHTPLRYVLHKRIERAKALVVETDRPLVEIALDLGFSSQSHFTAIFRKLTGETPRHYREFHRT